MQGIEFQLQSMGVTAARWPTMPEVRHARAHEARKQEMRTRARTAEAARRDREAWEVSRSRRPAFRRTTAGRSVTLAVVAGLGLALLIVFVVPRLV